MKKRSDRARRINYPVSHPLPVNTREVSVKAEPLTPGSMGALQEATRTLQEALRASGVPLRARTPKGAWGGVVEALRGSESFPFKRPALIVIARAGLRGLRKATHLRDVPITFPSPPATLIGFDLKIEHVGIFRVSKSLEAGLSLAGVRLDINILPPPTLNATLLIARTKDVEHDARLAELNK